MLDHYTYGNDILLVCVLGLVRLTSEPHLHHIRFRHIQWKADEPTRILSCSPHCTAKFLIRHAAVLLFLAPHLSHSLRL